VGGSGGIVVIGGLVVLRGMVGVVGVGVLHSGKNLSSRASVEGWRRRRGVVGVVGLG
jgi:hypothetical protein